MTPQLTDEQKEQLKMARRASMRIEETWSLYTMFLSQDKRPPEALERAQEAVAVWVEWMDNNDVEFPEVPQRDFAQELTTGMQKAFESIKIPPAISFFAPPINDGPIEAEFIPDPKEASVPPLDSERSEPKTGSNQTEKEN